jgi:valyl-tRNA synthetase
VEDRWIASRLQRAIRSVSDSIEAYDFSHAALDLYEFFWSELCDWYLEIVKPRLYDGEVEASENLLHVLEQFLALAHPLMPFVTEEVWSYLPGDRRPLVVSAFPVADSELVDPAAEVEMERWIGLVRAIRRWRDLAEVPARSVLNARFAGDAPHEMVARLARVSLDGGDGDALTTVVPVEILPSDEVDAERALAGVERRRKELAAEVARAEGKLGDEKFVAKAPAEVVEEEREKLARYRAELEELEPA